VRFILRLQSTLKILAVNAALLLAGILVLARISHRPGYHSDFGEDVERKSHQAGWAV
jgi:hypothetical protein